MADIFQTTFAKTFMNEKFHWCLNGLINNIPSLVQIMAWCRPGDKPLSEPMMAYFTDACMCRSASMSELYVTGYIVCTPEVTLQRRRGGYDPFERRINISHPSMKLTLFNSIRNKYSMYQCNKRISNVVWNRSQMNVTRPYWWSVNICSGNGLVSLGKQSITGINFDPYLCRHGKKPLAKTMWTAIDVTIWRH